MTQTQSDRMYMNIYSDFHIDRRSRAANPSPSELKYDGIVHRHNTGEFVLVIKGASTVIVDQSIAKLEGSFLIYYPPLGAHQQINDPGFEYDRYSMSIDPSYFNGEAELPDKLLLLELTPDELEALLAPVELLYRYFSHNTCEYTPIMYERREHLLRLFLAEVRAVRGRDDRGSSIHGSYIGQVCLYINSHIGEGITLAGLSERFFICRAKLTRDFRAKLGMSVGDYISACRIGRAKYLLQGELSIADIAAECGWSSAAHFVRSFKKAVGITPAKYRAESLADEHSTLTVHPYAMSFNS